MKLVVKNFQSLKAVTLMIEGFTVITGKSNLGKSAVVRALSWAFFGMSGDFFVRNGADQSAVGIKGDDFTLEWYRIRGGTAKPGMENSIKVNGKRYTKIGRDQQTLTEPLGVKEIKTAYAKIRPQVADQQDKIFLLSENEATSAEVLQALGRIDVITEAQRRAKGDLKSTQEEKRIREGDLAQAETELHELDYVPTARVKLNQLKQQHDETYNRMEQNSFLRCQIQSLQSIQPRQIPKLDQIIVPTNLVYIRMLREWMDLAPRTVPPGVTIQLPVVEMYGQDLLNAHNKVKKEEFALEQETNSLTMEMQIMQDDRLRMEQELGICPTCGRKF